MPSLPSIGTYWHGSELGLFERVCIYSMLQQGHSVTLFSHEKVDGIPEGVEIHDAREVTGDRTVTMYLRDAHKPNRFPNPSLFSNLFRYKMIKKLGMLWLDLDVFLLKPLFPENGYMFAWEGVPNAWEGKDIINTAILTLPQTSPTLNDLIEFCENEYPVPPFFSLRQRCKLHALKTIGKPVHVSFQKWGVWGPGALTYFLIKNGEANHSLDSKLLYPINSQTPDIFLLPADEVKDVYLKDSLCIHIASCARGYFKKLGMNCIPADSYLSEIISTIER